MLVLSIANNLFCDRCFSTLRYIGKTSDGDSPLIHTIREGRFVFDRVRWTFIPLCDLLVSPKYKCVILHMDLGDGVKFGGYSTFIGSISCHRMMIGIQDDADGEHVTVLRVAKLRDWEHVWFETTLRASVGAPHRGVASPLYSRRYRCVLPSLDSVTVGVKEVNRFEDDRGLQVRVRQALPPSMWVFGFKPSASSESTSNGDVLHPNRGLIIASHLGELGSSKNASTLPIPASRNTCM